MGQDLLKQMVYDSLARCWFSSPVCPPPPPPPPFPLPFLPFGFFSFSSFPFDFRLVAVIFGRNAFHSRGYTTVTRDESHGSSFEREHLLVVLTIPESKFQACRLSVHLYVLIDRRYK